MAADHRMSHLVSKGLTFLSLLAAPVMLAAAAGLIECPASMCLAQGGTGINKFAWAGEKAGIEPPMVLLLVGVCKLLALLDIFILKLMPKATLVCVGIMFAAITYAHVQMGDSVQPVLTFTLAPLAAARTWPIPSSAGKAKKKRA